MKVTTPIYLDNNATTAVDPRVLDAMLPYFLERFGNAASKNHAFGWEAEAAVDSAREQVARLIGASSPREVVFTSGATESDNLAIKGVAEAYREKGNHIVTCVTEHKAVLDCCKVLEKRGFEISYLPVNADGFVDLQRLRDALTDRTILISIMAANNEIGILQPTKEIGRLAKERGILFHSDATQAVGKIPLNVEDMGIDLLSLTAHKIYGPKGIGALYVRATKPRVKITAQIDGGGHERGMRSGTLNVPGIVGLGKAAELAQQEMGAEAERLIALRERLKAGLFAQIEDVRINGDAVNTSTASSPTSKPTSLLPASAKTSSASSPRLDEVDPELLATFEKLGIPLDEQKLLAGVAVDAVFDSVSVATTFKEKLASSASSSARSPRRCASIPSW
jgi:cysteine desulfurase